jgi:hypothetical protein
MKKMYKKCKSSLNRNVKCLLTGLLFFSVLCSCKEQGRFEIGYSDAEPPSAPVYLDYRPLYGGARIFYKIPADEDVLSIDAAYTNTKGEKVWFSVSYFQDSIDVYGFSDTLEHVVQLYSVDRAGNISEIIPVSVTPMEPAYTRVAKSLFVKAGFSSFFMDWVNELEQNINVYADFSYTQQGKLVEHKLIYTSNLPAERWFVRDLYLTAQEPVSIKIRVEDPYGNITDYMDKGQFTLLEDELIPKDKWTMPDTNDSIGGVPQGFFAGIEGRAVFLIDGIIDDGRNTNYTHTLHVGRTGLAKDGNVPWNVLINLGDEYELSRVITHQRYTTGSGGTSGRGQYYRDENVGIYNMYVWDDTEQRWDSVTQHKIVFPLGRTDMEYQQMGMAGDMAYLYPDDPQFSRPTRWFRYEALFGFADNYTMTVNLDSLSEITLYGRKKR